MSVWNGYAVYYRAECAVPWFLQKCSPVVPVLQGVSRYSSLVDNDEGATSGSPGREASGSSIEALASPAHTGGVLPGIGSILSGVRL